MALPYSLARRAARRAVAAALFAHALWRALILVALGIFLRSIGRPQTNFTFEDTLTQIGLGYPFLFLLGAAPACACSGARSASSSSATWLACALYPLPRPGLRLRGRGRARRTGRITTAASRRTGTRTTTSAWAFDVWFLNLFPRAKPFVANGGG